MSGGKDTTLQEKQMRKAMTAIDTLYESGEFASARALERISNYAKFKRKHLVQNIANPELFFACSTDISEVTP